MRLIQLFHPKYGRRIGKVENTQLILIEKQYTSCYSLYATLLENGHSPAKFISSVLANSKLDYNQIYKGNSPWSILPSFDHPEHPALCLLSGTGLTHKASAENRQKMHQQVSEQKNITDSMEIYLWGEKGGKPAQGEIGVQPEWFYKGNGASLKACNEPLKTPPYADDGGEEPEIAGVYLISPERVPYRVGFTMANEFSDHVMEKKNYLYLAPSKLRSCAIGPELVLHSTFRDIPGRVAIKREDREIWAKDIKTGVENMSHSLANLEYHHFKYEQHRIPGMVHIHFFGADAFSYGENIQLQDGDIMKISFDGFGKPLCNTIVVKSELERHNIVQTFE